RSSQREFSAQDLTLQEVSNLLWAACGVNRPESGKRTAPSSMNMQEIDIYVVLARGLYLYDATNNAMVLLIKGDMRELTGKQPFVKDAPVNLIYVADFSKMSQLSPEVKNFYAATDTGFISENVYLYCSSAGLATVVRGWFDRSALEKGMGLRKDQKVILTQTVGFPKKP
ncbi:MAG: SagB/ThcOx family dehydrogenase, partial [Candidatus Omnitrophica bacterium]|nr:SagB/ThcOx family dehydrogenase [Candidatus Omnitrophota bacterium]